jgi:MFS family permease
MILSLAITTIFTITSMITVNFSGLYITGNLMIPQHFLAYFPILRSAVIIIFMFFLQSGLDKLGFRYPMLAGILIYIISHIVLILSPTENIFMPMIYIFIEACAYCLVMPRRDSIIALLIDPDERARIFSIITVLTLAMTIPFGYLAGWLSDIDRRLAFSANIIIFIGAFILIALSKKLLNNINTSE